MKRPILLFLFILLSFPIFAQVNLTTSPYVENFDGIGSGLPNGFTTRLSSSSSSLGTSTAFSTAAAAWNATAAGYKNMASATAGSAATTAVQAAATDRALGLRQTSATGYDPGSGFTFQIANTTGKSAFKLRFDLQSLDNSSAPRTTNWAVEYGFGATPTSFTAANTTGTLSTGGNIFSNNNISVDFGTALDNNSGPIWIRLVCLSASTGSGNRPTTAIDNFNLTFTSGAAVTPTLVTTPNSLDFGTQFVNTTSAEKTFTLTSANLNGTNVNLNTTAPYSISKTTGTGFGSSLTFTNAELSAGSTTIYSKFTPTVSGTSAGSISINGGGATDLPNVSLTGTGQSAAVNIDKTSLDFGSQNAGTNSIAQSFILSATGLTADVNIVSGAPFFISKDNLTYVTSLIYTTAELAGNKTVYVRFSPASAVTSNGNIAIATTGATTQNIVTTGIGTTPPAAPVHIVISEVYGGGGNAGATFKNDFIELYNPGNTSVDLTGWSVQYAAATGTSWQVTPLSGSIPAKSFFLIQEAAGSGGTVNLPTPDVTGTIAMSGTTFKIVLSNTTTALTGTNPSGVSIVDKIGVGPTANGFEGTGPAAILSNTASAERKASATSTVATMAIGGPEEFDGNGYDSGNNNTDFITTTPKPQNSAVKEPTGANHIVISEVYGGGGNAGSVYKNDFIELYNPTLSAVDLSGWSVQYASATGTSWQVTTLSGSIAPKSFYLIQEAAGTAGTTNLPTADKVGTIAMAAGAGKVLLANVAAAQTSAQPSGTQIIDFVGYGATANAFEGSAATPVPSATFSVERKASATSDATSLSSGGAEEFAGNGYDSDDNAFDFIAKTANPQNSTVFEPISTSGPYLLATPKTLAFSNQAINTASASKSYVLSAGNLSGVTTLTTAAPFSISKNNTTFTGSITFTAAELAINQTVYVKFNPTAVGNANGAIVHSSTGATSVSLALSGAAIDPNQTVFTFENCTTVGSAALSDGFSQYSIAGPQTWGCTTTFGHDANDATGTASTGNALQINGFSSGNILNQDWLISPALNLSAMNYAVLSFWTRSAFAGDKLQLKVSTNYAGTGDPSLATWTDLDGKFPEPGSDIWTKSGNIDLTAYKALPVYVAIIYNSTTSSASRWTVDDFAVVNSSTPPPVDITTSTTSVNFGFQAAGTTSAEKSFTFSAGNLTGDVTVSAPSNFTISNTSNGTYTSTLNYTKGAINNTSPTIYAKFTPTAVNTTYSANVSIATAGSANKVVNLSGNTFDVANTLEVVNWNIEWFGSPAQDPSNDVLQAANVKTVVNNINADVYGFAEVVDTTLFRNTVLPAGYNVIFSPFGSYADNKADADYPLAQKLAFMYRTDLIKPIRTFGILEDTYNPAVASTSADGTPYKNWSSGRFPFAMEAEVTINGKKETIYFIEIHAKANTGTTADQIDSYNRRKGGNLQLKNWIDANLANKKVIILGDFNDVLNPDKTIAPMPAGTGTSYSDFTLDAANYFPITLPLSLAGKQSTAGFNTVIDNVIINKNLNLNYIKGTAEVLDGVKTLISNYSTTTTDHYPVKTRYLFGNSAPTLSTIADQSSCYTSTNKTIALSGISAGLETTQTTTLSVSSDNPNMFDVLTIAASGADKGTITYHFKNNVGGSANIMVTVTDNGGTDYDGINVTTKTFKLTELAAATATISGSAAVCNNAVSPVITFTGANGTAPYTFTYNINGGANRTISTSGTNSSVTLSAPTNATGTFVYNLTNITDVNCGQPQTGTATVTVNALPEISITGNKDLTLSKGEVIILTATGGTQYNWMGSEITSARNAAAVTIRPKQSGTYQVTVTNASGCVRNQTIFITVVDDYKLEASTVITPNGDGYNDKFIIKNIDYYPNNTLKIFDKTGRVLYTRQGYANDWDGVVNGSPLLEGTYYYIIDLGTGIGTFKGFINIIRD